MTPLYPWTLYWGQSLFQWVRTTVGSVQFVGNSNIIFGLFISNTGVQAWLQHHNYVSDKKKHQCWLFMGKKYVRTVQSWLEFLEWLMPPTMSPDWSRTPPSRRACLVTILAPMLLKRAVVLKRPTLFYLVLAELEKDSIRYWWCISSGEAFHPSGGMLESRPIMKRTPRRCARHSICRYLLLVDFRCIAESHH